MLRGILKMAVMAAVLMVSAVAMGQEQPKTDQPRDGGGRDRGRWDPQAMRDRMSKMMQERMGATDDEWKVLAPKIEKLFKAQMESRGMGGFFGRGGGPGGPPPGGDNNNQEQSAVTKATQELRTALENKDTPADQIAAKITALREAREKSKAEITALQKELKELLTARQEATLIMMGVLE